MPQIFPKTANRWPLISLVGVLAGGVFLVAFIWYYFAPEYTDVGYTPEQPVPFSHTLHAGELGVDCRYCHSYVEVASHANIPSTQTCMNCHSQIQTESLKLLPVRESWATGMPVPWIKVHQLADYALFDHRAHVHVGIGCESCHGRIDQMEVVMQAEPLSMGWCLDCHRAPEEHLRPPSEVTTMGYQQPDDFLARNLARIAAEEIYPPENCSACHY